MMALFTVQGAIDLTRGREGGIHTHTPCSGRSKQPKPELGVNLSTNRPALALRRECEACEHAGMLRSTGCSNAVLLVDCPPH